MGAFSLRLPESLHEQVRQLARRQGISINQFIAAAVAEKLSALMTEEHLEKRARRGDRVAFDAILCRVRDAEPDQGDGANG